jgi:hypothetical protein
MMVRVRIVSYSRLLRPFCGLLRLYGKVTHNHLRAADEPKVYRFLSAKFILIVQRPLFRFRYSGTGFLMSHVSSQERGGSAPASFGLDHATSLTPPKSLKSACIGRSSCSRYGLNCINALPRTMGADCYNLSHFSLAWLGPGW